MDSPEGVMDNWLQTVSEDEYRIFASLDDPLNEEVPWTQRENQFLIEYGGHYGLRGFSFFDDFLVFDFLRNSLLNVEHIPVVSFCLSHLGNG